MTIGWSAPTIRVNDEVIPIVPNSLSTKGGQGNTEVRAASTGGNGTITVHTVDAETKIGEVNFSVYVTNDVVDLIPQWLESVNANTVQVVETRGSISYNLTLSGASLVEDPEINRAADGVIELMFKGNPTTRG